MLENSVDFIKRVKSVIDEVRHKNIGNRIIIVTHPDIIQAAICAALDISADKLPKNIYKNRQCGLKLVYFKNWGKSCLFRPCPL